MGESGKYQELLEGSSSFSRLLESIHQRTSEVEHVESPPMIIRRMSSKYATILEDDLLMDTDRGEGKGKAP